MNALAGQLARAGAGSDIVEKYERLREQGKVRVTAAPDGIVCSALGCHEKSRLLEGYVEGFGERIFCGLHLARLIRRELMNYE